MSTALELRIAALEQDLAQLRHHHDQVRQSVLSEVVELQESLGLPTRRSLAAGVAPGGVDTLAGQLIATQAALEELHLMAARIEAKVDAVIEHVEPRLPAPATGPLHAKVDQAVQAATNRIRSAQRVAREQVRVDRAALDEAIAAGRDDG